MLFAYSISALFLRLVPILVAFHRIAYIAETYSLIMAVCELDIEALCKWRCVSVLHATSNDLFLYFTDDVLVSTEDMAVVSDELRRRIQDKICAWAQTDTPSEQQEQMVSICFMYLFALPSPDTPSLTLLLQFVHLLFEEVDQDGSGAIDKGEFRQMLRELNLSYRCTILCVCLISTFLTLLLFSLTPTATVASSCCSARWTVSVGMAWWRRPTCRSSCSLRTRRAPAAKGAPTRSLWTWWTRPPVTGAPARTVGSTLTPKNPIIIFIITTTITPTLLLRP